MEALSGTRGSFCVCLVFSFRVQFAAVSTDQAESIIAPCLGMHPA